MSIAADETGDDDAFTDQSIRLRRLREYYDDFSRKAQLPTQHDRTQVLGYGRSISGKAVGAERKAAFVILRSVGAKARNYEVLLPSGEYVTFTEGTRVTDIKMIAGKGRNRQIDELQGLLEQFGGNPQEWQKKKGRGFVDYLGESCKAEVHWYEEKNVGKVKFKAHAKDGEWILKD